ncbi:MAG: pyridoxamine 5'-phosphate oxidase [Actinomycetota bacterium]|nr:pyridoxamine 5'-phosphate oxidase [Actinomycetota bacterium]
MADRERFPVLLEADVRADPLRQFEVWFADAGAAGVRLPEAMVLATATAQGLPSARMVLLKGVDGGGFVFFTNYESRKGRELGENPFAALVFYWDALGRQVRVEGNVERIADTESDSYFRTRPLASRIGAWASPQSETIESREALERLVAEVEARFPGGEVPRPPLWGGFRLVPDALEFWQHRESRLHDRIRYERRGAEWVIERLAP